MSNERDERKQASDADFVLADDDFELAKETEVEQPVAASASGMRQSAQGLLFEPRDTSGGYDLQGADGSWSGEQDSKVNESIGSTSENVISPPSSPDDIYGVQAPSTPPPVAPPGLASRVTSAERPVKKVKKSKIKSRAVEAEDEGFSLDALYARRFAKRADDDAPHAERPELPERPLTSRLFTPFLTFGFALRFGIVALATAFLMTPCLYIFARLLSNSISEMTNADHNIGAFFAFFSCVWDNKFALFLFSLIWTALATPHYFQLWLETASGSDEVDDWGGFDFVTSVGGFLWLLCIITLAGIPGAALMGLVGLGSWFGLVVSSAVLTPFCLLSCIQSGGYFTIFSKDVALSVKKRAKLWLYLTCATVGLFIALLVFGGAALYRTIAVGEDSSVSWLTAFGASIVFAVLSNFGAALYLRVLGRVAWVVDEDARERREAAEAAEATAEESEFDENKERVAHEDASRSVG